MTSNKPHHSDYLLTRYMIKGGFTDKTLPLDAAKIPVALFGLGRAGIIHLENLISIPRFQVRYIIDSSHARLQRVRSNYCLDETTILLTDNQAGTVFSDDSVVAVIIATPSDDHEGYASPALKAGKHVLCEKPVALDIESIKKCYRIARENDRILLCAFNRRYDPCYADVKKNVKGGAVGQVHSISTVARDSPKPTIEYLKISGGIFHDCIVHDIDLIANFVLGERPKGVFVAAHAFDPEIAMLDDFDTVSATLQFESGVLGHIDVSREAVYGYDQRLEVLGNKGMIKSENQRPNSMLYSQKEGCTLNPIMHSFPSRYKEAYTRQLEHFLAVIDGV